MNARNVLGGVLLGWACLTLPADALDPPPPAPQTAAVAAWLAALGQRREGSPAEERVQGALRSWFGGRTALQEAGFADFDEEHSFSRRLWFRVAGTLPGDLVVAVPTDGSNDTGLAWAVSWADAALSSGTGVSLTFLFTGAERGAGSAGGLGSRAFLQEFSPSGPAAVLYLDTTGSEDSPRLVTESGAYPSPLWLVRSLDRALQGQGLPARLSGTFPSLLRLDLQERRNALQPWFDAGVPGLWLAAGPPSAAVVTALRALADGRYGSPSEAWDRHWLALDWGGGVWFWDQATYVAILLVFSALILFGYAALGRLRRGSLRRLGPVFWQAPLVFAVLYGALAAGTGLVVLLGGGLSAGTAGLVKGAAAAAVVLGLVLPRGGSPLAADPEPYGQLAFAWLGALMVGAAAVELTFSFYFLWALVAALPFLLTRSRVLRALGLLLGPFWLLRALAEVLGPSPDPVLAPLVLASPGLGDALIAVVAFPFLLQAKSLHLGLTRGLHLDRGRPAWERLVPLGLAAVAVAAALSGGPAAPRGAAGAAGPEAVWTSRVSRVGFLDRTVWTVRLSGPTDPEQVDLGLRASEPLTVYECSFPLVLDPDGRGARIVVGRQPRLPLTLSLSLPSAMRSQVLVTARTATGEAAGPPLTVELTP